MDPFAGHEIVNADDDPFAGHEIVSGQEHAAVADPYAGHEVVRDVELGEYLNVEASDPVDRIRVGLAELTEKGIAVNSEWKEGMMRRIQARAESDDATDRSFYSLNLENYAEDIERLKRGEAAPEESVLTEEWIRGAFQDSVDLLMQRGDVHKFAKYKQQTEGWTPEHMEAFQKIYWHAVEDSPLENQLRKEYGELWPLVSVKKGLGAIGENISETKGLGVLWKVAGRAMEGVGHRFSTAAAMHPDEGRGLQLAADDPRREDPNYKLVDTDRNGNEMWTRHGDTSLNRFGRFLERVGKSVRAEVENIDRKAAVRRREKDPLMYQGRGMAETLEGMSDLPAIIAVPQLLPFYITEGGFQQYDANVKKGMGDTEAAARATLGAVGNYAILRLGFRSGSGGALGKFAATLNPAEQAGLGIIMAGAKSGTAMSGQSLYTYLVNNKLADMTWEQFQEETNLAESFVGGAFIGMAMKGVKMVGNKGVKFAQQKTMARVKTKSAYETLNIKPGASPDEIRNAYLAAAKRTHPDVNQNNPNAAREFDAVRQAYNTVMGDVVTQAEGKWWNRKTTASVKPEGQPGAAGSSVEYELTPAGREAFRKMGVFENFFQKYVDDDLGADVVKGSGGDGVDPVLPEGFRLGLPMRREVGLNDLTGTQSEGTTALSPQEEAQLPVNQVAARQQAEVDEWRGELVDPFAGHEIVAQEDKQTRFPVELDTVSDPADTQLSPQEEAQLPVNQVAARQQADSALAEGDVRASETTSEQASEGRNGDAVDSALIEHSAMIRSELRKMGVRPGEMEDMMQDVALRALDKANTFDPNKAKVQTWLGAVARNVAKNQFAKNTAGMRDQRLTASLQAPVGGEGTTELQDLIAAKGPDRSISAYQEALAVTPLQDLEADVRDGVLAGKGVEDIAAEQGFTPQKIRGILRVVGRKAQKNLPPEVDEWRGELNDPAEELNKRFAKVPDWTKGDGESKQGANLVAQAAAKGRNAAGVADIVQYVNKLVQVEMRRSKSQTSRKHPAHYRRTGHLAMTRNTQSQINFHEAGHGLKELLVNQMGGEGFFQDPGVRNSLLRLTKRPGSMASAENVHEGVAEWMRLKVTNPGSIQDTTIDVRMESAISKYLPNVLPGIRDAARAYNRFMNQPAAQRWATFNKDQRQAPTMKEGLNVVLRQGQKLVEGVASGAPVSRLDRQFARQAIKAYRESGDTLKVAAEKMRKSRKRTQELIEGHNILLQIGAETQLAYSGTGPARGVRYIDQKGKVNVLLPRTWNDIIKTIPPQYYEQFEQAGWALESLNRHVQDGMEYPGFREGISLEDLKGIVAQAEKEIPNFKRHFDEVQSYFDALLDLRERSGMLAKGEKSKIQRREMYWPLPRVMNSPAGHRGATGADMGTGLRRAFGSGEAIQDLNTVAEHYTRQAYSSVYWNQFANQMFDNLQSMAKDNALPMEVRSAAGRVMIPLKMPQQKVAEVSKEWIVKQAYDAVAQNIAEQTGESVKQVKEWFQPENLNLATEFQKIYRPGRPNDVNVLSFLKDGERQYVQVSDDALFMGFAKGKELSAFWKGANWLLRPTIENWKRNITQSLPFAVNNLMGDVVNQTMMNTDKVGWFPGGATVLGVMNKFSKKYPQVFQEGLLLSRVQPTETELLRNMQQNAVMRFLTEGLYVSQHPDKTVRLLQTVFQPANWLFPLFKAGDIVNLVTLGKTISPFLESASREGASVAALKRGATDREAMLAYWNVTGPFNEHSPSADLRSVLAMPGFFNPQIQAVRRTSQLLTDPDPAIAATAWTKLMVMVPAVFGSIAALRFAMMDDDEKDRERERPLDDRLNYHDVMGFRARFPYGAEGAMASLVYNSVMDDLLDRSRVDGRRKSIQLLKRIADAGSPTQFLGPQINTLQEAGSNWSYFRQRHIVSPWLVNLPAAEQHYTTTPAFYKKVGRFLEYSPTKLEYIVNQGLSRQVGEIVRILDNMDRNKPIGEMADLPFIGRMFMRNPAGWFAQSPQDLSKVQATLSQIDRRLRGAGWSWIKDAPYGQIRDKDLYALRVQLDQLESLKAAVRQMPRYGQLSKAYQAGERWEEERNVRRAMVMHAQAALAHNEQEIEHLDTVLDLLEKIGDAPPEIREWDYRRRTGLTE